MASRGQEEAPFSLLLAVAMMAMVIPVAAFLFDSFQSWECEQRVQNNMQGFARDIELSSTLGGTKRIVAVDLALYSCPGLRVDNFTLTPQGRDACQQICHDPNCMLLEGVYEDKDPYTGESLGLAQATSPVCVRIPVNMEFITDECFRYDYEDIAAGGTMLIPGYYQIALIKEGYKVFMCKVPN
ncbi:hypothetical protein ACFLQ2_00890 [archaeon]